MADAQTPPVISAQVSAPLRVLIGYAASNAATYMVAKGVLNADQVGPFVAWLLEAAPFVIGLAHMAYSSWASRKSAKVASVQAMPDMQVVTTSQATKDAVPGVTKVPVGMLLAPTAKPTA